MWLKVAVVPGKTGSDTMAFPTDSDGAKAVAAAEAEVAERQFQIALQQAGAELPTLRTINKFISKHVDALTVAWDLCPELEVLCMSLSSALEEKDMHRSKACALSALPASTLSRGEAAPEYMHLVRSVVELVNQHVRPRSAASSKHNTAQLLQERKQDVQLLRKHNAAVKEYEDGMLKAGSDAHLSNTFKVEEVLMEVLRLFDQEVHDQADAQLRADIVSDQANAVGWRDGGEDVTESQLIEDMEILCAKWCGSGQEDSLTLAMPAFTALLQACPARAAHELQILTEAFDDLQASIQQAGIAASKQRIAELEPAFPIAQFATMADALRAYVQQNEVYACLAYSASHSTLSQGSVQLSAERQCADKLLILVLFVRALRQVCASGADIKEMIDKYATASESSQLSEFLSLFQLKRAMLEMVSNYEQFASLTEAVGRCDDDDDNYVMFTAEFCPSAEGVWLSILTEEARHRMRDIKPVPINVPLTLMRDVALAVESETTWWARAGQLLDKMTLWELDYPLPAYSSGKELLELFDKLLKDPALMMIGLATAFSNRAIGITMLKAMEELDELGYRNAMHEIVRAFVYLKDNRDPAQLLTLDRKSVV
jgi:hypothetical protein